MTHYNRYLTCVRHGSNAVTPYWILNLREPSIEVLMKRHSITIRGEKEGALLQASKESGFVVHGTSIPSHNHI